MLDRIQAAIQSPQPLQRLLQFIFATLLFSLPVFLRRLLFYGKSHHCPVCESHIRGFIRLNRVYNITCPVCRSFQRHRLVWLLFQRQGLLTPGVPQRMLHFAPEASLAKRWAKQPDLEYLTADLYNSHAMLTVDISDTHLPGESFDVIYCSHVLEHVFDDRAALRELRRLLKPGGKAVILVPITARTTIEDPLVTDPVDRERLFGQHDHVRRYGPDFIERLDKAGYQTQVLQAPDIASQAEIERMGLSLKDVIYLCTRPV